MKKPNIFLTHYFVITGKSGFLCSWKSRLGWQTTITEWDISCYATRFKTRENAQRTINRNKKSLAWQIIDDITIKEMGK
ncbi:MAG: hypothetical protein WC783_03045 [Candidatus Paceibacterota bacterium]